MKNALRAGVVYFGIVFAVGFLFGVIRVTTLLPYLNEALAVIIELPFMLAISWGVCRWSISKLQVGRAWMPRIAMGSVAFGLLMVAESTLAVVGFGRTMMEHLQTYWTLPGMLGLGGQILFALFPVIQLRLSTSRAMGN